MSAVLREGLPVLPARMAKRPVDHRGYPVPWFVQWIDGKPDFRVVDGRKFTVAIRFNACWLCGEPLGRYKTFVIGPMCAINRVTSEPPCHADCAEFAALSCPFLVLPTAKRRETNVPEGVEAPAGVHLKRNPGAVCLWTTLTYSVFPVERGPLIRLGDPICVEWFAHGRPAMRAEVLASIESGMPHLYRLARAQSVESVVALECQYAAALPHLPAEALGDLI